MHNRKKLDRPPTDAEVAALQKKSQTYASLVGIIFERRKQADHSADTLGLIGKMLRNNPDFYSLWNFRREILQDTYPALVECSKTNKFSAENADQIRDEEMGLSAEGITKNPKSYGAWHHRQWIISKFNVNFDYELSLCKEFLRQDQRNFHCWNYRRFVAAAANVDPSTELAYSQEKIQENFSNYSAFHHRSIYIKRSGQTFVEALPVEFQIVENAIFTEPDDQSAWWYHQFLLTWASQEIRAKQQSASAEDNAEAERLVDWFVGVLLQQRELVQGLYELEDSCTWVMNCLIALADLLGAPQLAGTAMEVDRAALRSERCELLQKLLVQDPNHRHRYNYLLLQGSSASSDTAGN